MQIYSLFLESLKIGWEPTPSVIKLLFYRTCFHFQSRRQTVTTFKNSVKPFLSNSAYSWGWIRFAHVQPPDMLLKATGGCFRIHWAPRFSHSLSTDLLPRNLCAFSPHRVLAVSEASPACRIKPLASFPMALPPLCLLSSSGVSVLFYVLFWSPCVICLTVIVSFCVIAGPSLIVSTCDLFPVVQPPPPCLCIPRVASYRLVCVLSSCLVCWIKYFFGSYVGIWVLSRCDIRDTSWQTEATKDGHRLHASEQGLSSLQFPQQGSCLASLRWPSPGNVGVPPGPCLCAGSSARCSVAGSSPRCSVAGSSPRCAGSSPRCSVTGSSPRCSVTGFSPRCSVASSCPRCYVAGSCSRCSVSVPLSRLNSD